MKLANLFSALGLAACIAAAPASAKEWKTVRIGMDATYPPFESVNPKARSSASRSITPRPSARR